MAETKARHIANLVEDDGDVKSAHLDNITVTPTAVSDQANTSTGYLDLPSGTTNQRPGGSENSSVTPNAGNLRFNTDQGSLEVYSGTGWIATNEPTPTITSISGTIYAGLTGRSLTITGTDFNTDNISIEWLDGVTRIVKEDSIIPTSATSVTRTIPQSVYDKASDTTIGIRVLNAGSVASNTDTSKSVTALPSGGTKTGPTGGYYYHTFNDSDSTGFTNTIANLSIDFLLVAGGGGGGSADGATYYGGGGGGAGGAIDGTATLSVTNYPVVIGGPGSGGSSGNRGTLGDPSTFNNISATGGGGGGSYNSGNESGGNGGSGGGGRPTGNGGTGTAGPPLQGYRGGNCPNQPATGAGGGGRMAQGQDISGGKNGGNGGDGINWKSLGTYYAGGGGGGLYDTGSAGTGGQGGGGDGSTNGATNKGGGGGGGNSSTAGANGGKGVCIIRYQLP